MGAYSLTSGVSVKTTGMFWNVFSRLRKPVFRVLRGATYCDLSEVCFLSAAKHLFNELSNESSILLLWFFSSRPNFCFSPPTRRRLRARQKKRGRERQEPGQESSGPRRASSWYEAENKSPLFFPPESQTVPRLKRSRDHQRLRPSGGQNTGVFAGWRGDWRY